MRVTPFGATAPALPAEGLKTYPVRPVEATATWQAPGWRRTMPLYQTQTAVPVYVMPPRPPAVVNVRGPNFVDHRYFASAVVVDAAGQVKGKLVGSDGFEISMRSSAKPFQALPLLEWLQANGDPYHFKQDELAVMVSSHWGDAETVKTLKRLFHKIGLVYPEKQLVCGAHPPLDPQAAEALVLSGKKPSVYHHQCVGNHAAMWLAARLRHPDALAGYADRSHNGAGGLNGTKYIHPLQHEILNKLYQLSASQNGQIKVAQDGCGAPAYQMPIENAAKMYAKLASAEPGSALAKIRTAMTANPKQVGGNGLDRWLMAETAGRLVAKHAIGGVLFVGNTVTGEALAIKVESASDKACDRLAIGLLTEMGWLSVNEKERVEKHFPIKSTWKANQEEPVEGFRLTHEWAQEAGLAYGQDASYVNRRYEITLPQRLLAFTGAGNWQRLPVQPGAWSKLA